MFANMAFIEPRPRSEAEVFETLEHLTTTWPSPPTPCRSRRFGGSLRSARLCSAATGRSLRSVMAHHSSRESF